MKTFQQFLYEANVTHRLKMAAAYAIKKHWDNPEKREIYRNLLKRVIERTPSHPDDTLRHLNQRKDKFLIPSHRPGSFPELVGMPAITKNPKKLRKQKALGEIL